MIAGIILIAIGARCAVDKDNEVWQTVCGVLVALIGVTFILAKYFPTILKVLV